MTLIPKGPLKKSMSVLVTSHCEKPAASGDMSFGRVTTSKKSESQYRSEVKVFDSSKIVSPFLEPKVIEQRVIAAKKAQR